jgi:HAD superfamily hydrolase (TIGR01509 family)
MSPWQFKGRVITGSGRGAGFTKLEWARRQFIDCLGVDPYPGTLNLTIGTDAARSVWGDVRLGAGKIVSPPSRDACDARCFPVRVAGRLPAAIVVPQVSSYDPDQVEIIAAVPLRDELGLRDGDEVEVSAASLSGMRAAVFDVDGTLVNSIEGVRLAAARAAAMFGYEVPIEAVRRALNLGESLWDMIIPEEQRGDRELESILRVETMRHWPQVLSESVSVFPGLGETLYGLRTAGLRLAICTGSRGESFLPLQRAGLMDLFDAVVTARDVARPKPDPEGLLRCLETLGCEAAQTVYVGDSCHDMAAGRAAGMRVIGVLTGAADGALLSLAGADRLIAGHQRLKEVLVPA